MSSNIQRSDYLRYLLLAMHGGIYTDTDTILLKPPSRWTQGAHLWKDGEGWLSPADMARIAAVSDAGESERGAVEREVLGPVGAVVGIEADVGDREDWADWWPRPVSLRSFFEQEGRIRGLGQLWGLIGGILRLRLGRLE